MNIINYIKQSLTLDYRSLALFRMLLGILVICDVLYRWGDLENFYTDAGLIPRSLFVSELTVPWSFSIFLANGTPGFVTALMGLNILLGIFLALGFKTRSSLIGIFLLTISIHNRNWLVQNGGDDVFRVLLFFSIWLPLNKRFSIDSALTKDKELKTEGFFSFWSCCFFFQVFSIYFFSFILKDHPAWRIDFTATYYALRLEIFSTDFAKWLLNFPALLKAFTVVTIYLEAVGPLLLLTAGLFRSWWWKIRVGVIASFWMLHLGIIFTLKIGLFPYICLAMWLAFIPAPVWDKIFSKLKYNKLTIYYDEDCAFCKKTLLIVKEFLLLPENRVLAAQSDSRAWTEMNKYNSWIVVNQKGSRFFRFDAITEAAQYSPLLKWLVPVFKFKPINLLGNQMFLWVSRNSKSLGLLSQSTNFTQNTQTLPVFKYCRELIGMFFLGILIYWNLFSAKLAPAPVEPFKSIAQWAHIFQGWGMFSPQPKKDNIWVEIPAVLSDGSSLELLSGSSDVTTSKSDIFPSLIPNEHWRKFYLLLSDGRVDYAKYYGGYLCREWNDRQIKKVSDTTLRKMEIKVFSQENLLDGTKGSIIKKLSWTHWCFKEDFKRDNP